MKKMGSIRVRVQEYDNLHYQICTRGISGPFKYFVVPKSAVTEIREEVEREEVKKDAKLQE